MKIEITITDDSENITKHTADESLLSIQNLESAANRYAESENSAYTNDYYGYLKGAKDVLKIFIPEKV